jgi:hypothetical protein
MPATRVRSRRPGVRRTCRQSLTAGASGCAGGAATVLPVGRPSRGSTKRGIPGRAVTARESRGRGIAPSPASGRIVRRCLPGDAARQRKRGALRNGAEAAGRVRERSGGRDHRPRQILQKQGDFSLSGSAEATAALDRRPAQKIYGGPQKAWRNKGQGQETGKGGKGEDRSEDGLDGKIPPYLAEQKSGCSPGNSRYQHVTVG